MSPKQENKPSQTSYRQALVRSTDTPLRFFVHLLLIIEGVLGVVLTSGVICGYDRAFLFYVLIAFIVLAGFTLLLVYLLVVHHPENLVFDKQAHLFRELASYGDEKKIMAYEELLKAEHTEAPRILTDKKKDETTSE